MLAIGAGVDFPWIAYQDCVKPGTVEPVLYGKVPVRWVHLRDEIWAASGLILRGELSFVEWIKGFFGKPIVVAEFSWDDVWPGLIFWAQAPRQIIKRLIGRNAKTEPGQSAVTAEGVVK